MRIGWLGAAELLGALVLLVVPGAALNSWIHEIISRDLLGRAASVVASDEAGHGRRRTNPPRRGIILLVLEGRCAKATTNQLVRGLARHPLPRAPADARLRR